jgi:hypothetical protein
MERFVATQITTRGTQFYTARVYSNFNGFMKLVLIEMKVECIN